jgi:uncharacterized protein (DUF1800 family)
MDRLDFISSGVGRRMKRAFGRRSFILKHLGGGGVIFSVMLSKAENTWSPEEAAHLLNRAGFGGTPAEIEAFHQLGRHAAVESLLEASDGADFMPVPEWARPEQAAADRRARAEAQTELRRKIREMTPEEAERARRLDNRATQQESRQQIQQAQGWWFRRMLHTRAPLREKMTLFWHDHFSTSAQKVRQPALLVAQNELFRHHATGDFRELTRAVAKDPAMMIYLDSRNSRKGSPNENFARELLELFTLGEGNYTEGDIREAARAFTGYGFNPLSGVVTHQRRQWDERNKTIFGKTGRYDGDAVVDLIFQQKAAAVHLPAKLWEFFVEESPSPAIREALAERFEQADFHALPLLRDIFLSREFYDSAVVRSQIKSPVQYLVQLLKHLEIVDPPQGFALDAQQQLGQVLFMPPNVAGWDWGKAWINTNTLLTRYNLAGVLTKGTAVQGRRANGGGMESMEESMMMEGGAMEEGMMEDGGMMRGAARRRAGAWSGPDYGKIAPRELREDSAGLVDSLIFRFFQGSVPDKHRAAFIEYADAKRGAVFTNSEVGELCHLILSTPYYQLC